MTPCLSRDEYFMAVARLCSMRSKDPKTQVGACVIDANDTIVATGYNGMPAGHDELSWQADEKHTYVCHAEMNAIVNKYNTRLSGCRMYVTLFPCKECAKLIIHAGIKDVYYIDKKDKNTPDYKANIILLEESGVRASKYEPKQKMIPLLPGESGGGASTTDGDEEDNNPRKKKKARTDKPEKHGNARKDFLDWEHYFMAMAKLTSLRSRDPSTKVGACIVALDNRVVGFGYNDMPPDGTQRWEKTSHDEMETKYPYVCHAGANAVMSRFTSDVTDSTLYITHFPCNECVKIIIQAGIKKIIYGPGKYNSDKYEKNKRGTKEMLEAAQVDYRSFDEIITRNVKVELNIED